MIKLNCQQCGVVMLRQLRTAKFCKTCLHQRTLAKYALGRRPFGDCIFCGSKKNVQAHHIDKNRKNNAVYNLLAVCKHCHNILHTRIYKQLLI